MLHGFIARNVCNGSEAIETDAAKSCLSVEDKDRRHETVRHTEEEWLVGDVQTNSISGMPSQFKRSIICHPRPSPVYSRQQQRHRNPAPAAQ